MITKEHIAKVAKQPRVASGSKLVTWIGLSVTTLSGACMALGMEWIEAHLPFMRLVCAVTLFGGAIATSLGKGLADKRTDADRSAVGQAFGEPSVRSRR